MKIKLSHSAQIVGARNKVDQHAPGAEVETDDEQANRLIANGYAKEVKEEVFFAGAGGAGGSGSDS